jgi:hypothetical protein
MLGKVTVNALCGVLLLLVSIPSCQTCMYSKVVQLLRYITSEII